MVQVDYNWPHPRGLPSGMTAISTANVLELWSTMVTITCFCLILCCKLPHKLNRIKKKNIYNSQFCESGIWERLSWVFWLQNFLEVSDKILAGAKIIWRLYWGCEICFQDGLSHGFWQEDSVLSCNWLEGSVPCHVDLFLGCLGILTKWQLVFPRERDLERESER